MPMPSTGVPQGYLFCDGSALPTSVYTDLYNQIGYSNGGGGASFRVPDLRGVFIRGTSNGTGRDPDAGGRFPIYSGGNGGDQIGSWQGHEFYTHAHSISDPGHQHIGGHGANIWGPFFGSSGFTPSFYYNTGFNGAGNSDLTSASGTSIGIYNNGGNESRPLNVNMNYMIRYR